MKQKVALVLSGGGARGIAHIGAIEEIEKHGFEITSIAGTSMGSLVGGIYALGKLDIFKNWLLTIDKFKVFKLIDFSFSNQGLIKGDRVLNTLKQLVSDKNIEELNIPYAAVAVNLKNKQEVVFTEGSIFDAIRASISIPSVFTPVKKDDCLLVDGGVLNNIPVNHVSRTENDLLIAVDVNADVPLINLEQSKDEKEQKLNLYQEQIKKIQSQIKKILPDTKKEEMGYFEVISQTIEIMTNYIAGISVTNNPPDLLINISRQTADIFDFFKSEELIETGRIAAINALKEFETH